jgi:hypothetical protein
MKKFVIGCLVVLVLAAVVVAAGSYFLYRAASPYIEDARNYVRGLSELGELEKEITNQSPHSPPSSGELTEAQVQRFARVHEHVRTALGQRMHEFEEKYKHLSSNNNTNREPSFTEMMSGLRDLANVFLEARRYQVEALNKEGFSQAEYSWVRLRVFEAAGVEVANMVDLSKLQQAIREGTGVDNITTPDLPKPDVPARNRELVKPYMDKFDEWLPLTFFGL